MLRFPLDRKRGLAAGRRGVLQHHWSEGSSGVSPVISSRLRGQDALKVATIKSHEQHSGDMFNV